jgi:hypothetical protein
MTARRQNSAGVSDSHSQSSSSARVSEPVWKVLVGVRPSSGAAVWIYRARSKSPRPPACQPGCARGRAHSDRGRHRRQSEFPNRLSVGLSPSLSTRAASKSGACSAIRRSNFSRPARAKNSSTLTPLSFARRFRAGQRCIGKSNRSHSVPSGFRNQRRDCVSRASSSSKSSPSSLHHSLNSFCFSCAL